MSVTPRLKPEAYESKPCRLEELKDEKDESEVFGYGRKKPICKE